MATTTGERKKKISVYLARGVYLGAVFGATKTFPALYSAGLELIPVMSKYKKGNLASTPMLEALADIAVWVLGGIPEGGLTMSSVKMASDIVDGAKDQVDAYGSFNGNGISMKKIDGKYIMTMRHIEISTTGDEENSSLLDSLEGVY